MLYNITCYQNKRELFRTISLKDEEVFNNSKIRNIKLILTSSAPLSDDIIKYISETRIGRFNKYKQVPINKCYCYVLV